MKENIVGGFVGVSYVLERGSRVRAQIKRREENPICRHFCTDIVPLFISKEKERKRSFYCHIGILPQTSRRAFLLRLLMKSILSNFSMHSMHPFSFLLHLQNYMTFFFIIIEIQNNENSHLSLIKNEYSKIMILKYCIYNKCLYILKQYDMKQSYIFI